MTLAESLRTFWLADSAVTALVSTRIYPESLPQNAALPAVRYEVQPGDSLMDLSSYTAQPVVTVLVEVLASGSAAYSSVSSIAEALINSRGGASAPSPKISEFHGTLGSGGVWVQSSILEEEPYDEFDPPQDGSSLPIRKRIFSIGFAYVK